MAGIAKPNIEGLKKQASYKLIGFNNQIGNTQPCGLFDGITTKSLTETSFYWYNQETYYIEIEILSESVNIWKIGYGEQYKAALKIYKYNDITDAYEDISSQISQTLQAGEMVWEKTISNLSKGKYKFCGNSKPDYETTGAYYRLDTEWYIEEEKPQIGADVDVNISSFPVLIGDETIQKETDISSYAGTLVEGEKQLLISDKLKSIYVTNGQGSYTKLSGNEELINDTNKSDTTTYSSIKIEQLNTEQTRLLMEKSIYDYNNDGVVNSADMANVANKIQGIESAPLYSVYGKSPSGIAGFYEIPIGTFDEKDKFQSVRQDVQANVTYTIELANTNELNDFIIQGYEFLPGKQNVVTTLKEFNNTNKDNFLYDEDNITFDYGMSIKNKFSSESVLNSDGINEISMNDFLSIYSIDLEVTK